MPPEEKETAKGQDATTQFSASNAETMVLTLYRPSRRRMATRGQAKDRSECLARLSIMDNQATMDTPEGWTMEAIGEEK